MSKRTNKYIYLIIFLALVLRFIGIKHGFPFIFHPDEPTIVRSALGIRFYINPAHFDWPHLYIYLNYFLYMIFAKFRDLVALVGYKDQLSSLLPIIWNDDFIFYLLTRSFTAILGALTVIPVYLITKTIFNKKAAVLAALAIAITPFHVWHSHYSLADVPMVFLLSWSLYFSSKILFKNDIKNYIWAGLFAGLSASTKYNGLIIVGAIVLAHILRVLSEKDEKFIDIKAIRNLFLSAVITIFGFFIGTPFALLDFNTFTRTDGPKGALWQFTNVGSVDFIQHIKQFFKVITYQLSDDFGYTFFILFIASFVFVIVNMIITKKLETNRDLLFFTLIGIGIIYYVSGFEKTRSHYFFMCYPPVIISGIGFLSQQFELSKKRYKELIWVLVFSLPLYFSVLGSYKFYNTDTRQQLYYWLIANNRKISKAYTNDKELKPIFEKVGVNSDIEKKIPKVMKDNSIYISADENLNYDNLNNILFLSNKNRRGPVIKIYSQ